MRRLEASVLCAFPRCALLSGNFSANSPRFSWEKMARGVGGLAPKLGAAIGMLLVNFCRP